MELRLETPKQVVFQSRCEQEQDESRPDARVHFREESVDWEESEGCLFLQDYEGRGVQIMPYRPPGSEVDRRPQHARPSTTVRIGGPRKLGHVN